MRIYIRPAKKQLNFDLDGAVYKCRQLGFGGLTYFGAYHITIAENHQCGYPADAIFLWSRLVLVHVHLRHDEFAIVFLGKLFKYRGDCPAGATPFGPVIDHYRCIGI